MRRCLGLVGVLAALLTAGAFPTAAGAFSWEAPTRISDPVTPDQAPANYPAQSAITPGGVIEVAWDANNEDAGGNAQVRSARRDANGAWADPVRIANREPDWGNLSYGLNDLLIEPDGDAIALLGGKDGVYASVRRTGSATWSHPELAFTLTPSDYVTAVRAAAGGDGEVVVFYDRNRSGTRTLRRADWDSDDAPSAWTDTAVYTSPLDHPSGMVPVVVDMNDSGAAALVASNFGDFETYAFTKPAAGAWSGPTLIDGIDPSGNGGAVAVGVDPAGNAHLVAESCQGEGGKHCAWEAKKPAGGSWSAISEVPHVATESAFNGFVNHDVRFAPDGKAVAVIAIEGAKLATMTYSGGPGGTWSAPVPVPTPQDIDSNFHKVVLAPDGTVHVVYLTYTLGADDAYKLWATRLPAGASSFTTPELVDTLIKKNWTFRIDDLMVDASGLPAVVYQNADQIRSARGGDFPKPEVTPASVDFGSVQIDGPDGSKQVKLKNVGDAPLHVSKIELTGPFTATGGTGVCVTTLAPGASCEFELTYHAPETSERTGTLVFTHDAKPSSTTVAISATGHKVAANPTFNAASLEFGSVEMGQFSPAQAATLTNSSGGPLHIFQASISGQFTSDNTNVCDGVTLQAGQSCTVHVRFQPYQPGPASGAISFVSDYQGPLIQLPLNGNGVQPTSGGGGDPGGGGGDPGGGGGDPGGGDPGGGEPGGGGPGGPGGTGPLSGPAATQFVNTVLDQVGERLGTMTPGAVAKKGSFSTGALDVPAPGALKTVFQAPLGSSGQPLPKLHAAGKKKPVVVAKGAKTVKSAGKTSVKVKLTKAGKKLMKRRKSIKLTFTFSLRETSGRVTKRTKTVRLGKRPR